MCVPVRAPKKLSYKPKDSYHGPWEQCILSSRLITNPGGMQSWCPGVRQWSDSKLREAVLSLDPRDFKDSLDSVDVVTDIISVNNKCSSIEGYCLMTFFPYHFNLFLIYIFYYKR